MLIARWQIDARFGQKTAALELMRRWEREIGPQVGLPDMAFGLLTGSIGAREATIEANHRVESLARLEAFFTAIGALDAHHAWSRELEPHVVSGTSHWQIFREL